MLAVTIEEQHIFLKVTHLLRLLEYEQVNSSIGSRVLPANLIDLIVTQSRRHPISYPTANIILKISSIAGTEYK